MALALAPTTAKLAPTNNIDECLKQKKIHQYTKYKQKSRKSKEKKKSLAKKIIAKQQEKNVKNLQRRTSWLHLIEETYLRSRRPVYRSTDWPYSWLGQIWSIAPSQYCVWCLHAKLQLDLNIEPFKNEKKSLISYCFSTAYDLVWVAILSLLQCTFAMAYQNEMWQTASWRRGVDLWCTNNETNKNGKKQ